MVVSLKNTCPSINMQKPNVYQTCIKHVSKINKQYYVNTSDIDIIVNEKYNLSKKKVTVKAQALLLPNLQHSI